MSGAGKRGTHQEDVQSSLSEKIAGSKLVASLKLKKGNNLIHANKHKPKPKSHVKTIGSTLSKRKVTDSSSKEIRRDSPGRKSMNGKILKRTLDTKFSKKLASSKLQGKISSVSSSEANMKNVDGNVKNEKLRRKKKRQKVKVEIDEASRLQRRTRYLLIKMKLEQNLIDAYSGEGWKGQSREKIKPEKELQRAKKQILKCKLGIRDAIRQLDSLSSTGSIENSVIAPDGSVYHEHIFCAKCKLREAFPDNDIVLCDGTCNRAFHQKCLDPPLDTNSIPPGDQGWFCKFCDCKMEIIEAMNAHIGTRFSVDSNWLDIFKEEAAFPDGGSALLNPEEDWPSDDSEDDDYNPERRENSCSVSGASTHDDVSDDASSSTSLSWSSGSGRWGWNDRGYKNRSVEGSADSDGTSDGEIVSGRRRRRAVDYKKLYDEMFGKDAPAYEQVSEDEDWGPAKRKRREKESDAVSTLMTLYESEKNCPNVENKVKMNVPPDGKFGRPFRIPPNAVQKLRQVFAEDELPSRTVKENLSKELGLEPGKVSKWFKNARYVALKTRKADSANQLPCSTAKFSKESGLEVVKKENADSMALKDTKTETVMHTSKKVKIFHRRKNSNLLSSTMKNNHHKGASPVDSNKVNAEFSDDVSLKKLLKSKLKREKKKVNLIGETKYQAREAEMERLCRAKVRLENMKQRLSRLPITESRKSKKTLLHEVPMIYVPFAVLKEKASSH
ncbi:Homeobox domain-containing protein/PHD domain-containing protein [Cephalotus follicularis]|uniref:Homeobox domain-containing protein/PHD domain-containing protein n=1 Tax=Cephalotus follicularis TaxID=3775 RepID=A0A1Q3CVJ0_CEPFO|nr:Homeobox domain-containing protein/PHD domain-containing protein [Cephalotus follicularis]